MTIPVINYNELDKKKELGHGSFGVVYLGYAKGGVLPTNVKLAIKEQLDDPAAKQDFKQELEIFKKVGSHKNVVRLLGYCARPHICIVMEYVTMKVDGIEISGLHNYARRLRRLVGKNELDHAELESFSLQIAQGMEHLEKKKIVHRDLAARNILIDQSKTLKISDFGLSRPDGFYRSSSKIFPYRWSSPEANKAYIFTSKGDVWSYGIVLWEIATLGDVPYLPRNNESAAKYIIKGNNPGRPDNVSQEFFNIMLQCWAFEPDQRPTFTDLIRKLTELRSNDTMYFRFNDPKVFHDKRVQNVGNGAKFNGSKVLHPGIFCNHCLKFIFGIRYKCITCPNYDLCQDCKRMSHHRYHSFQEIVNPIINPLTIHYDAFCNICWEAIIGIRYKCSECPNYDLCQTCKHKGYHKEHRLSSILWFMSKKSPLHVGVRCDGCDGSILGLRFKCEECPNYDLCETCKAIGHHKSHSFEKIENTIQRPTSNRVRHNATCDICSNYIMGIRYKCSVCPNYDLCETCRGRGHHKEHRFSSVLSLTSNQGSLHAGFRCDVCDGSILGIRFQCTVCVNYDLCETCKVTGHHKQHPFQKILNPTREPLLKKTFHRALCDMCSNTILGIRYKCSICPNYDLCQTCKEMGHHTGHRFSSILSDTSNQGRLHVGVRCDACDGSVLGVRFKCLNCPNYDLCETCKKSNHHAHHSFIPLT